MYNSNFESITKNIPVRIFENKKDASIFVAHEIAAFIKQRNKLNQTTVLGLATGSSPLGVYAELIRLHQEKLLSFKNVITFNLDEYYPMTSDDSNSYHHFMYEHFFKHIDIKPENINIPDGALPLAEVENFCTNYDQKIAALGGIDIQLLGIGRSGHIGFNEPGSTISSPTRLVKLHGLTIEDATKDFGSEENVPSRALTMGLKTILQAKKILLVSWGETKAGILRKAIEEEPASAVPASFLQHHPDCLIITDKPAASQLSQFQTTGIPMKLNIPFLSEISSYDNIHKISEAMDKLDKKVIGHAPWHEYSYKPDVKFAMAHSSDDIFLKYYICEQQVKAIYFQPNDPVYRDSCVEFFISFGENQPYYNLEFNSLGTCLMGYGPDRENRRLLPVDLIRQIGTMSYRNQSESADNKNCWELMLTIPREVFCFHSLKNFHGLTAHANFYKCGDDLTVPHFLAWNNIHTPNPDFHQPNFFGMLAFA